MAERYIYNYEKGEYEKAFKLLKEEVVEGLYNYAKKKGIIVSSDTIEISKLLIILKNGENNISPLIDIISKFLFNVSDYDAYKERIDDFIEEYKLINEKIVWTWYTNSL